MATRTRWLTPEQHPSWKGGKSIDSQGYVRVTVTGDHPLALAKNAKRNSFFAFGHQLTVYNHFDGQLDLKGTNVHHRNDVKSDNELDNLVVFKNGIGDHRRYHNLVSGGMSEAEALARIGSKNFIVFDPQLTRLISEWEKLVQLEKELEMKSCRMCRITKHLSDFTKSKRFDDGRTSYCKKCDAQRKVMQYVPKVA